MYLLCSYFTYSIDVKLQKTINKEIVFNIEILLKIKTIFLKNQEKITKKIYLNKCLNNCYAYFRIILECENRIIAQLHANLT